MARQRQSSSSRRQVVRFERAGDAAGDGWTVRVIGAAGDELAAHTTEEDAKLEL